MKSKVSSAISILKELNLTSDEWLLIQIAMGKKYNNNCYAMMGGNNKSMLCGTSTKQDFRQLRGLESLGAHCFGVVFSKMPLNTLSRKLNCAQCDHSIEADNGDRIIIIERNRSDYI